MMTRFVLTLLIGLVVSLGALVSGGSGVAWDGNWNLSDSEKAKRNAKTASEKVRFVSDKQLCAWAELDIRLDEYRYEIDDSIRAREIERRSLNCFSEVANNKLCSSLTNNNFYGSRKKRYLAEIKRRGLSCGVIEAASSAATVFSRGSQTPSDKILQNCFLLQTNPYKKREFEKKNRVVCGELLRRYNAAQKLRETSFVTRDIEGWANKDDINHEIRLNAESIISRGFFAEEYVCKNATRNGQWYPLEPHGSSTPAAWNVWYLVARYRGLSCRVQDTSKTQIVLNETTAPTKRGENQSSPNGNGLWYASDLFICTNGYLAEAKRRGLSCGVGETTQTASAPKAKPKFTSAALTAAEKEAERLRQELAALKAKQQQQQQTISNDTQVPLITITQLGADGRKGSVKGYAKDNVQVAEVLIDGQAVRIGNDGSFEWSGFVPATGKEITIEAIDTAALSSTQIISLKRGQIQQASGPRFDVLDPTAGKKVKRNSNALALIVGISDYERTDAPAVYADKDAQYFHDYASLKLGIPDSNIKTMVNAKAEQGDVILAVKDWMRRSSKPGKTDVYVFFAGHGLASDDGEQMYLLPYDGRPRLLDKTAILRQELFDDIASANPRSVTVFLDTCYSGTTRGTDMLIASRPIAIKALEQSVPDNFTVMTAARGDQTAKPLEEAKHGMFSYFLMKGMEGEADKNQDNKITAGELHSYVQQNVVQQSSGSQTPELQGDADRVLVRFK